MQADMTCPRKMSQFEREAAQVGGKFNAGGMHQAVPSGTETFPGTLISTGPVNVGRSRQMTICKIWDSDYPWDIRVEKVAQSLTAAGHSVHLVCRNQARRGRKEWNGSFAIHRLPSLPQAFGSANTPWNFPYPVNPVWIKTIARVIRDTRANLILVRDIPLALPAVILGKVHRIPVILDMAENYPAMLQDRLSYTATGLLERLIRRPAAARLVERLSIRLVDHILVVVEESRERLIQAGVRSDKLSIVCNTPRPGQWELQDHCRAPSNSIDSTNLVYLGNLDGSRGIDVAIRAVRHLKDVGRFVRLSVIGDGPSSRQLRDLAVQLGVTDRMTIMGRLSFSQVKSVMAHSHVGLIPHYATEAWNSTIPNKLFDYMLLGLPVIVSDVRPMSRIVRTEGCGEVFRDRDEVDLARCIAALADPQVRRAKGINGQSAISKLYNWNCDSQVLVRSVETVRAQYGKRSSS
jgi:glycosyltransferase involved in cell wall biosynthesis